MKKVSIIIPCYNQAKFIAFSIESAIKQTYKNIEIICVNDGSTDESADIIREYSNRYENILFLDNTKNKGTVCTKNLAIEAAQGEYILPLDADDVIEPQYVEKAVEVFETCPETALVYCKANLLENGVKKAWTLKFGKANDLLYRNFIFNSAMFKKSDFEKVGGYKECMNKGLEDWELWLSFLELYKFDNFKVVQLDEFYFYYRQHDINSRNNSFGDYVGILQKNIVVNHKDLYFSDSRFFSRIFSNAQDELEIIKKKHKKYKKLFNIFLFVDIALVLLIIVFLFYVVR